MISNVLWLKSKVGSRQKSLELLGEMAQHIQGEYKVFSRVGLPIADGPIYKVALVTLYDGLEQMQTVTGALSQSDAFNQWFEKVEKLFKWQKASWESSRILRRGTFAENNLPPILASMSIDVTPGKLIDARSHLNKLAEYYESKHERPTVVSTPLGGRHYRHFVITHFDSLNQFETISNALEEDADFGQWAVDMMGMFDNRTIERRLYQYV